jgi:glycyl-tRNA synthetase
MAKPEFTETLFKIKQSLTRAGISNKVDDSGLSVGKRYARTDELGIPFGITVDYETI